MEEQDEACDKATDMEVDKSGLGDEDDVSSEVSTDSKGFTMILKTPEAEGKWLETRPLITQISWGKRLDRMPFTRSGQAAIPQQESPVSQSSLGAASCRSSREASHQEPPTKENKANQVQKRQFPSHNPFCEGSPLHRSHFVKAAPFTESLL